MQSQDTQTQSQMKAIRSKFNYDVVVKCVISRHSSSMLHAKVKCVILIHITFQDTMHDHAQETIMI